MPREAKKAKQDRALSVAERMDELYPAAACLLDFKTPFSLVIAVLLSAQTTDAAVNRVTPELFRRWPDPISLAGATQSEVASVIRRTGFYQVKAKHCIQTAQMLVSDFAGEVPSTMAELTRLPGVGRKTANIVLTQAFGIVEGIAVDTHVFRIAHCLRFAPASADTPAKVEQALLGLLPKQLWGSINHRWVQFGREFCIARKPRCMVCPLADLCPSAPNQKQANSKPTQSSPLADLSPSAVK
ncbi:MAG: endonuclease III [Coriobacteriales bacterium]|jgi:endonuclease-3|nr:endonuclease III [Coriobacteriales bacterium]